MSRRSLSVSDMRVAKGRAQQFENPLLDALERNGFTEDGILELGRADPFVYDAMVRAGCLAMHFEAKKQFPLEVLVKDATCFSFFVPKNDVPAIADFLALLQLLGMRLPLRSEMTPEFRKLAFEAWGTSCLLLEESFQGRSVQSYLVNESQVIWEGDFTRETKVLALSAVFPLLVFSR